MFFDFRCDYDRDRRHMRGASLSFRFGWLVGLFSLPHICFSSQWHLILWENYYESIGLLKREIVAKGKESFYLILASELKNSDLCKLDLEALPWTPFSYFEYNFLVIYTKFRRTSSSLSSGQKCRNFSMFRKNIWDINGCTHWGTLLVFIYLETIIAVRNVEMGEILGPDLCLG